MIDYKPLDETRNEIRVLSLCPEQQAGLVRCRLEHVSLDEALEDYSQFVVSTPPTLSRRNSYDLWHAEANDRYHHHHRRGADTPPDRGSAHPRYYRFAWGDYGALSYTWGDQSQTRPILLNDTVFHVGRNLEAALHRLARYPDYADGGLKLWVDAICINQRDLRERGRQVRRMGEIFSRALIVTIWLGELPSDDTTEDGGMGELQTLVSRCRDDSTTKEAVEEALKKDRELGSALHAAVERLVTVTYWTRTWIIQEKCLGPFNASLLFGPHVFSLMPLRNFLACANNIQGAIRKRESAWQILKLMELAVRHQERQQPPAGDAEEQKRADMDDLGLLLMLGRLAHTTDPRDKLYGLLGLLPRYVSRHIEPDYTLPVARVFADFAAALIRGFDSLDLVLAGNSPPASPFASPFVDAVPSWVPDLTDRWDPYLWSTNCDATPRRHHRPLGLAIEDEGATLVVKGVVCDVVAGTAPQLGWDAGVLGVLLPAQQIIKEVVIMPPPDVDLKTAIVRTLHRDATLDCHAAATLLDIPWLDGLRLNAEEEDGEEGAAEEKAQRIDQRRVLLARGWGPVLRHANFADFQQFRVRLDALYAPWPGRRFRDFFPRVEEEGGDLSGERQAEFLAALEKHAGIVYPVLTTRRGRFGTSIHPARVGDVVAVVPGCYAPVLLRRNEERSGMWRSVSHCYVEGLMRGEAMEWLERGEVGLEELRIV